MSKTARRRSRELALQGLYGWVVAGTALAEVKRQVAESQSHPKCDREYLDEILEGVMVHRESLDRELEPLLDRPVKQLSPIEHVVLLIAAWELVHQPGLPFKVVANEAIDLAKSFGGTDGHKFVNGVLDRFEAERRRREGGDPPPPAPGVQ
jgi:transcription antitermination protein NusB